MQAIILAAGASSRFHPYRGLPHKSFVSLLGKTIFEHTLASLKDGGITDVVVVAADEKPFKKLVGDSSKIGLNIKYSILPKPLGMGQALLTAEKLLQDKFFLVSPHHLDFSKVSKGMAEKGNDNEIVLLGKKDSSSSAYGYMKVKGDKVLEVTEKPEKPDPDSLRIIHIYYLNKKFVRLLSDLAPEHYNFETALDEYAKTGNVKFVQTSEETVTLKYPWDLLSLKDYMLKNQKRYISQKAKVSESSEIIGNVHIEDGAKIMEDVVIRGPAYIGKNAAVGNNCLLRDGAVLEEDASVGAYMEVKNSIIMKGAHAHSGFIGDSVIGENSRIGAAFTSTNVRIDRENIEVEVKEQKVNSHLRNLGVIMGRNVAVGGKVSTMPGVIIGENSIVGPSTTVLKNVPSNVKYYTKFEAIVEKKQ